MMIKFCETWFDDKTNKNGCDVFKKRVIFIQCLVLITTT